VNSCKSKLIKGSCPTASSIDFVLVSPWRAWFEGVRQPNITENDIAEFNELPNYKPGGFYREVHTLQAHISALYIMVNLALPLKQLMQPTQDPL
jgi:hypothetical protein